jgi:hypothetical protein
MTSPKVGPYGWPLNLQKTFNEIAASVNCIIATLTAAGIPATPITPVPPPSPGTGGVLPLVTGQISPGTGPWLMADPSGQCIGVPLS